MMCIDIALLFQTDVCCDLLLAGSPIRVLLRQPGCLLGAWAQFSSVEIYSHISPGLRSENSNCGLLIYIRRTNKENIILLYGFCYPYSMPQRAVNSHSKQSFVSASHSTITAKAFAPLLNTTTSPNYSSTIHSLVWHVTHECRMRTFNQFWTSRSRRGVLGVVDFKRQETGGPVQTWRHLTRCVPVHEHRNSVCTFSSKSWIVHSRFASVKRNKYAY